MWLFSTAPSLSTKRSIQWFEAALEGGHYLAGAADVFEAFAGEGALEFLGAAGEFLGPRLRVIS